MSVHILNAQHDPWPAEGSHPLDTAGGPLPWPMHGGAGLATAGAWNLFLRLGALPRLVDTPPLRPVAEHDVVVAHLHRRPQPAVLDALLRWTAAGGGLLLTGSAAGCLPLLAPGLRARDAKGEHPFAALAWLLDGGPEDGAPQIAAPPRWDYLRVEPGAEDGMVGGQGRLALIGGERQTPGRALVHPLADAPALLRHGRTFFLNANPFSAYQSWLQAQEPLSPWLNWRPRLFWLDEYAAWLWRCLLRVGAVSPELPRPGIAGLPKTTIVLRHDVDSSRGTHYLEASEKAKIPCVFAVLDDENADFWTGTLRGRQGVEACYHFNTARKPSRLDWLLNRLGLSPRGEYLPARRELSLRGMERQLNWAKTRGIGIETIHKHGPFTLYPEHVHVLDELGRRFPELLGACTYLRGQFLRWGARWAGEHTTVRSEFPDAQFPCWLPFRLGHAADGGRLVRPWECTALQEPEPGLVEQMLDHRIAELPQRVLVLVYHPAHAVSTTFSPTGVLPWHESVLTATRERSCTFSTMRDVFRAMNATCDPLEHT